MKWVAVVWKKDGRLQWTRQRGRCHHRSAGSWTGSELQGREVGVHLPQLLFLPHSTAITWPPTRRSTTRLKLWYWIWKIFFKQFSNFSLFHWFQLEMSACVGAKQFSTFFYSFIDFNLEMLARVGAKQFSVFFCSFIDFNLEMLTCVGAVNMSLFIQ